MPTGIDWIFWLIASLLGLLAVYGYYRAFFADWARGRERCPKCWYDMSGTDHLVCSECGHDARKKRRLYKTRRHWWRAAIALIFTALAIATASGPKIYRDGKVSLIPTTALVLLMPDLGDLSLLAHKELLKRVDEQRLWAWQWKLLVLRCQSSSDPLWETTLEFKDTWPEGEPLYGWSEFTVTSPEILWALHAELRAKVRPVFDASQSSILVGMGWSYSTFSAMFPSGPLAKSKESALRHGITAAGPGTLEFEVDVECLIYDPEDLSHAQARRDEENWTIIHSYRITESVQVTGELYDYISLDDSEAFSNQLKRALLFELHNSYLQVIPNSLIGYPDDMTVPIIIDLYCNGELIMTWDQWLGQYDGGESYIFKLPPKWEGDERPFGEMNYADFTWSLKVRGNPARALLDDDANSCWAGSFDVPLYLIDLPDLLVYRSWAEPEDNP